MSRYGRMFSSLAARGEGAFVPFLMLGDPGLEAGLEAAETLLAHGADALELGIPFSDPVADGPVVQRAAARALAAGATPAACLEVVRALRARHPDLPIGLLVYANLVVHRDPSRFYREVAGAGADSVLVADVPGVESAPFIEAAAAAGVDPVMIVPADADRETVRRVARDGRGYSDLLSRAGVTGAETAVRPPSPALLAMLREEHAPPPLVGFGISTPAQVRAVVAAGAAGAISGSAVVGLIERHADAPHQLVAALAAFAGEMKHATRSPSH